MIKLIRSNQRVFLAGLTIFSMVAFLVTYKTPGGGQTFNDRQYGTIMGKPIYLLEVVNSRAELDALKASPSIFNPYIENPEARLSDEQRLDLGVIGTIERAPPELFMLLRHEANALGMQADPDDVQHLVRNFDPNSDKYQALKAGAADMLSIMNRYRLIRDANKISRPQLDQVIAQNLEALHVKLVQIKADDYLGKVPAPTTRQVQDQFNEFANTVPRHPTPTTNPFGFGYKLPQRSAFQYVPLTDDAITAAVTAGKSAYDWDVLAHKYFYSHPEVSVPPPTTSTTQPAGTLPFEAVQAEILGKIRKEPVDNLRDQVRTYITTTMSNDWQAYSKFVSANPTAPEPDSSLGVPYSSFNYLVRLYGKVGSQFNVDVTPDQIAEPVADDQIEKLPHVGSAAIAKFVTDRSTTYLQLSDTKTPSAKAALMQPSPALEGPAKTTLIFLRVTDAHPAEPPDLAQVRHQVEDDLRLKAAYQLAKDQAAALLIAANAGTLDAAALATGHPVLPGDTIIAGEIKGLVPPLGDSASSFVRQAFKLLTMYQPGQSPHPALTIELPEQPASRVFVTQLKSVEANWDPETYYRDSAYALVQMRGSRDNPLTFGWLDLETVKKRLEYKPLKQE